MYDVKKRKKNVNIYATDNYKLISQTVKSNYKLDKYTSW